MFEIVEIFKNWCAQKINLATAVRQHKMFRQGEVWWCDIGMNVGDEIFGKGEKFRRPILILKKVTGNIFLGLPMTSIEKKGSWYVEIDLNKKRNWIILSQARTFDARRLWNRINELSEIEQRTVQEKFIKFLSF